VYCKEQVVCTITNFNSQELASNWFSTGHFARDISAQNFFWDVCNLKGLSHEIFVPVFWPVWMYLGLNMNRLWLLNFNDAPLILDN
jgi:hypothetical protein